MRSGEACVIRLKRSISSATRASAALRAVMSVTTPSVCCTEPSSLRAKTTVRTSKQIGGLAGLGMRRRDLDLMHLAIAGVAHDFPMPVTFFSDPRA